MHEPQSYSCIMNHVYDFGKNIFDGKLILIEWVGAHYHAVSFSFVNFWIEPLPIQRISVHLQNFPVNI